MDGELNLPMTASVIGSSGADVAFLSEVDINWERSGFVDQPQQLKAYTGFHAAVYAPALEIAGEGGTAYYGTALLSRFPIAGYQYRRLPRPCGGEQRVLLSASVACGGQKLLILGTHLSLVDAERRAQVQYVAEYARNSDADGIMWVGDLNAEPGSPEIEAIQAAGFIDAGEQYGDARPTFPSSDPDRRIDYIFMDRPLASRMQSFRTLPTEASDHWGVMVEIQ